MLVVGTASEDIDRMLAAGVGPSLPADARCPTCSGEVGRWPGYRRLVRHRGRTTSLLLHRCRCRACRRTHALLPSFLLAYRRDSLTTIGRALLTAARGGGHRTVADGVDLPAATVRGWLRRARRDPACRPALVLHLATLAGDAPRAHARGDPLNWLLDLIAAVHQSVHARLTDVIGCPFGLASAITTGRLLSADHARPVQRHPQ